ncbi:MAG: peptidylprolyl isomerase [Candidatus Electryonea clarkiae]|nr:peptidylprolyl isomerase [Candidatus Electryonea clarkiae]MDP8285222.1 peptidylprolyl isomerase [Candidatus Electryonea clarkiae]
MRKPAALISLVVVVMLIFAGCAGDDATKKVSEKDPQVIETEKKTKGSASMNDEQTIAIEQTKVDSEYVVMETNQGKIVIGFFPDIAPGHVARFKELAREGFYEGIIFHRVIPGFVIQGGDPGTKDPDTPRHLHGTGGSGKNLDAEFNPRPHIRGTLSAARSQDPNSADSQFFICVARAAALDNKYTVYGHVLEGMDAVDKIVNSERDRGDNPLEPQSIISAKVEKREKTE